MTQTDLSVRTVRFGAPSLPTEHATSREDDLILVRSLCDLDHGSRDPNTNANTAALRASIRKKVRGYQKQDASKDRVVDDNVGCIEVARALVESELLCRYCRERVTLDLESTRDPRQWTLDRIENHVAHTATNVVVSCLACNLAKRRRDTEKFALACRLANHGAVVKL